MEYELECIEYNCAICLKNIKYDYICGDISDNDRYSETSVDCLSNASETSVDRSYLKLDCNHIFHHDCIVSWFIYSQNFFCPLCRNRNKKLSLNILNKSNFEDQFKFNRFKTIYYKCSTCEYECICDDFIVRNLDPENQIILTRRNLRLELCRFCAIIFFFFGIIISVALTISHMYSKASTPPNYRMARYQNYTTQPIPQFRRF
jgi:hypothetical protein